MKMRSKLHKFFMVAALAVAGLPGLQAADGPDVEKKKLISKSYPLDGNDKLSINNQFGEVKISTWGKNEVKVDITIIGKGSTDEKAQAILDMISIEDGKGGDGVHFKTILKNDHWSNEKKGNNNGMEVNYEIQMPATSALDIKNSFGKTIVPDMSGPVEISSKFGELSAGRLANVKKLEVEFGEATIESVNNADVSIKFSQAQINKMTGVIKSAQSYSGVKLVIDNSVTSLTIKNEFSDLLLDVSDDISASFDVYTNFSELKNKTSFPIKEEAEDNSGLKFDHQYNGKSGNANMTIKVKSNFGDVTIGHNLPFDVNEDRDAKERPERKERKEKKEKAEKKEKVTII
jgi:hypothetical protein